MASRTYNPNIEFRPLKSPAAGPYALMLDYIEGRLIFSFRDATGREMQSCKIPYASLRHVMKEWWGLRTAELTGKSASFHMSFDSARKSGHDDLTSCLLAAFDGQFDIGGLLMREIGTLLLAVVPDARHNPLYGPGPATL